MYARRRRRHLLCVHFVKVTESVPSTMGNRGCCCYLSVPVEILPPRTRLPSSCSPTCTPRNNAPRLHFRSRSRLSPTVRAPVSPSRTLSASRSLTNRFRFAREKWRNTSAEPRGIVFRLVRDYLLSLSLLSSPRVIARIMLVAGLLAMRRLKYDCAGR